MEVLHAELKEREEAVTGTYPVTGDFYSIFILYLWLRIIETPDHDF